MSRRYVMLCFIVFVSAAKAMPEASESPHCAGTEERFSPARIVTLANGKRYAIFGTGQGFQDGSGRAHLFLESLQAPAETVEIDTGVGHNLGGQCDDVASDCNALAEVELADVNGDGMTDWAYAGDLHGNVWAFDLTGEGGISGITATRLFTSCGEPLLPGEQCGRAHRQPITRRVALARNIHLSSRVENPNINVYWGTGLLRTTDDAVNTSPQAFYSVLHTGQESDASMPAHFHSDLAERTYIALGDGPSGGYGEARSVNHGDAVDYRGYHGMRQYGWYISLPELGERVLHRPLVVGDLIIFTSLVPTLPEPCDDAVASWVNVLSLADGLVPQRLVINNSGGAPVLDYNQDGVLDGEDQVADTTVLSVRIAEGGDPARIENDKLMLGDTEDSAQVGWRVQFDTPSQVGRVGWYQLR
ncbi:PilC/PilY family type IV pilus protein [Halomonas halocynthiae]|uniref:PilC/PilY family type IV pilus protein n=1 Tax=Halomonas halocynthiae TaxID=176290 RepID=UPI00040A15D1|nr:PilC/PilY family type IV pilus protein [Halomonas halocynthiae]